MSKTQTIRAARGVGLGLGVVMVVYLSTFDGVWEPDNPFLVADVLMGVLLLGSSVLPWRWAAPAMFFAFGWTAGILTVTVFNYLARGEFRPANLAMVLAALAGGVLTLRALPRRGELAAP